MTTELYDPFDKEWLKNKFKYYDQIRAMETPYWSEKYQMYILVDHKDVIEVLSKPNIFISGKGNLVKDSPYRFGMTPGASDGKIHAEYREIVKDAYSKKRKPEVDAMVIRKTQELFTSHGTKEFDIADDIRVIASYMAAEILNLPNVSKDFIAELVLGIQLYSDRTVMYNVDNSDYDLFVETIRTLIRKRVPAEQLGIYQEFMSKANKTTPISLFTGPTISGAYSVISAMQFMVLNLAKFNVIPQLINNRELVPLAVDECLRLNASTGKFARTCTEPYTLHGIEIQPDQKVGICLDAAMRDPKMFENPDKFDMHRFLGKSHPFGYGPHACAGQAIGRAGLEAFLNTLLDTLGEYEITTKEEDLDYIITATANNDVIDKIMAKKK